MIKQGYKQQQRGRQRQWRMHKRKQDFTYQERDYRTGGDHSKAEFSDALADQPDHRYQVVEIIQELHEAFHSSDSLANDGQHRAAAFWITRLGIDVVDRRDI